MAGAAVITLLTVVMLMHLFLATLYIMFVPNWAEAYKSTVISRTEPLLYYLMALAILVIICQLKPSKRAANSMPEMQL
jgi:type II secretory pathway component PulK